MRSARLSPEESSAIAVVYTMFLAYVVFRDAKLRDFGKVIKNALKTLAIVMTLLATAKAFAYMMTELRIPAMHFGVVMIFNLAVGLCTPPVGSALFVGCAIGKTPIERTSKNMLPLYAVMVTVLLLVTYIPEISLWLPRLTGYAG